MSRLNFHPQRVRLRKPGKIAKTTFVNEVAQAINDQNPPFSIGIENGDNYFAPFSFLAKIWDTGPASEANYADERYWLKPQQVKTGLATAAIDLDDDHSITVDSIITATNPNERPPGGAIGSGPHLLQKNAIVRVFAVLDAGVDAASAPKVRYVINGPSSVGLFPCTCVTNSATTLADYGDASNRATLKYDITPYGGAATVGANLAPKMSPARIYKETVTAGGDGAYAYNGTNVVLMWVNELADQELC